METASGNNDSPDGLYQRRVGRKIFLGLLGVGARPAARFINFYSADGVYSESLSLPGQAFQPDVMLGYHLNRRPLVREQGAPLRLVVPEMYGYKYAKWINRVEFSERQEIGYWEHNGYTVDAYLGTE